MALREPSFCGLADRRKNWHVYSKRAIFIVSNVCLHSGIVFSSPTSVRYLSPASANRQYHHCAPSPETRKHIIFSWKKRLQIWGWHSLSNWLSNRVAQFPCGFSYSTLTPSKNELYTAIENKTVVRYALKQKIQHQLLSNLQKSVFIVSSENRVDYSVKLSEEERVLM